MGHSIITPQAHAAATVGTFPMSGWYTDTTSGALEVTNPMISLSDQVLAGSSNSSSTSISGQTTTGGWIGTYSTDGTPPTTPDAHVFTNGNGSTNLTTGDGIGNEFSTLALDANMNGHASSPSMYFWSWNGDTENNATTLANLESVMGQTRPSDYIQPIFRLTPGSTIPEVSVIPTARYFADEAGYPLLDTVWSGGEVIQKTGEVFISGAECDNLDGAYRMMIWNPTTGAYNYSGQILPLSPDDDIFNGPLSTLYGCGADGTVASDMALDGDGNAYILVESTQPVPSMGFTTTMMRIWLVRVVPSSTGDWTYNLVTPLTAAPSEPIGSQAQAFAGTSTLAATQTGTYGMAFFQGTLYATNTGVNSLLAINPMSGYVTSIPPGTLDTLFNTGDPTYVYDLASGQTAYTIAGTIYNDSNLNGVQDATEIGVSGQTVALYMKDPISGDYTLEGIRKTDADGTYSFLVGGQGTYIVRLVQPMLDGVNAVQTGATGGGTLNPVVAQCGATTVTTAAGGPCDGAIPMPTAAPPLPTDPAAVGTDTSTQPDTMPFYSTVTITSDEEVATADFGIALNTSYGDSPIGPIDVASGAPVHNNGADPQIWLGATLGSYDAPATNDSHTASDDGVFISTFAGPLPLGSNTVISATYPYDMYADVSGPQADSGYVNAWVTTPIISPNTWSSTPQWSPTVSNGVAASTFQFATSASLGAGQPAYMRVDASTVDETSATNLGFGYQSDATGTPYWATPGEIEDYSLTVANSVYRPAVKTSGPSASFVIASSTDTQTLAGSSTLNVGKPDGVAGGSAIPITATAPDDTWAVTAVTVKDTTSGTVLSSPSFTTTGLVTSFSYTPAAGTDAVVEVDYARIPDTTNSQLTLDPNPQTVGQDMAASALIEDADGTPLAGVTVTFAVSDPDLSLDDTTCTTASDGTCGVNVTSTVAGTYTNALTAQVSIDGTLTDITGSPASPEFDHGTLSTTASTFTVTPVATTSDSTTWVPVSDGTDYYTGVLTAKDSDGNLIDDLTPLSDIVFSSSSSDVTVTSVTNTGNGTYSVQFSSEVADATPTASVTYQSTQVGTDLPIPFVAGTPDPGPITCTDPSKTGTNVSASPTELPVDEDSTITALITDEYCNPVSGVPVTFTAVTPTSGVVTVVTGTTGDDGIATATVTDSVDESVDVDVTITQGTVYGSPVSVLFDPGALSYTRSTFAVTPVANTADSSTWVPVSDGTGTDYYTGVLTALDTDGNPLDSLALTDISFTASSTDVTVTSVTNTGNGTYSVQFSSEVADATPTASVTYKSTQVGTSLPIPFVAGDPVPGPVTCTDSSKTGSNFSVSDNEVTAGDPVTVTAYITDEYCNPVDNATVDFSLDTGSDALLSDSSVSTGPDGVASTTLNDATAETVTVNATLGTDAVYGSPQDVTFDAGSFSYTESTFTVTPVADTSDSTTWVAASDGTGTDYYTGVLTAKDGEGNLLDSLTLSDIAFAASSSDVTVTSVTNTGNGTYSVRFSSEVADATPTASVTYQTTQVGTDLPIPFVAGTPDPGPVTCSDPTKTGTNVAASPTELAVDDDSTITALITDEYCNPVSGVPVTFDVVTPTSGVITTVTGTTGDDGIATATLTDAVAETVQATATITQGTVYGSPVSVTFDAGLFSYSKSTFTVTPVADTSDTTTWVPVSDGTGTDYYTGVLTAKDSDGNLLDSLTLSDIAFAASSSDVTVTSVTNTGNGTYSVQFSSEVADATPTASVTYQTTQVGTDLPIPFVAGTPDPGPVTCSDPTKTGTNVTASPTELAVDDDSTITALITDEYCNPVSGATVTFGVVVPTSGVITTVIGTTGDDGIATATLTDAVAETVQATATITQGTVNGSPVSVTFDAGLFSYTKSTFTVTPVADTSDSTTWVPVSDGTGTDYYTGVLTAKDSDGNLLDSLTLSDIAFAASSSDVTVTSVTNTGNGTYSVQFSSEVADATPTASVTYQTTQVGTDLPIPFVAGTPDPGPVTCSDPTKTGTNVTASPTELAVDDDSTITALITDEYCNPVSGATVTFGVVVPTSGVITTVIGTTGDDGIATATLTDAVAETVQATATITQGTVNGSPVSVTFDSGLFSYSKSTFTVTPVADTSDNTTWVPVSDGTGTDYYTGVLTAKDSDGNLLDSLTLSDIAFAASSSDVTVTSVTNTGNGTYSVQFSSEVADATPTASVTYQTTQVGTDLPIPFVAGTPDPGPVTCSDPTKTGTNVAASPTELAVDDDSTITALITDEYCNPVSGVPVTFDVVTPTSGVITTVIGTTGDDGIATATLTDAVAETVQATATITQGTVNGSPVSVTFDSGLFSYSKSTFTVTPVADTSDSTTWVPVSDGTGTDYYTGVLTAKDSDGNLLDSLTLSDIAFASSSSDVTVTSVTNTGNGTYSVQFSSEVADATPTASVTYQTTQVGTDLPIPFVAGTPDPGPVTCSDPTKTGTNVAASPTELAVDDDSTITALITDEYCNPVSGATVTFGVVVPTSGVITTVIGTTGDDGIATATLTDAVAETVQATATITQGTVNGSPVSVTFDTGLFSYSKSTFTVTPVADISDTTTWVPASDGTGTDYYTGVLTAKDSDGNLLDSLTLSDIAFASSSSDVTVTSVTNTGNGTYSVQFSSEVADATPTASVTYQTTQVGTDLPIPFVAGTPDPGPVTCSDPTKTGTNVTASPTELAVDDDSTITALITDEYCNPVSGVPVTFDVVTPTSGVITTVIGTTGDDGIATATLTDAVAETVQATATITQGTVNGSPVSVVFDTGLFSYTKSTFTVTPVADTSDTTTWVPVSDGTGTDYYTGVLTAKDSDGNLLDSLTLSDIAFAASSTDVTVTAVTNTGNGTYSVQFSSEVADATPTASVTYQTTQVGTDLPIPFVAGTPDPGPVTCSDPTKTGTNVSASPTEVAVDDNSTITALITDQYCNPVSGAVVSFAVVSNNSGVVTTVIGTTGADGIATATLTDAVAETVIASASISQGPVYGSPVSVVFDAGLFSYSKSTFTVTPVADTSDTTTWVPVSDGTGTDYYTGVLTAKDSDGNLLDSLTLSDIAFGSSSSDVTVTSVTNTGNGTYSVQYSSQVADATPTANVTYKTTQVGTDLPIPFVAGTPDPGPVTCSDPTKTGTNVTASPTEVAVDDDSTITALITDQYCNPVSGVPVTFDVVTPTSGVITTVIGTTGDDGIATATLTDAVAETVQATATIAQGTVNGSPVSVTFDAGLFSYSKSTFTVTPVADTTDTTTWVPVSDGTGTDYYTGVLTAKDSDGNLLDSLTLSDIAFASSSSDVTVTSVTNTGNGTYSVQYSSTVADATPTASVTYKTTQVGTDLPIPFVAGTPDPGPITCSDPTKTGTNVSASPTEVAVDDNSTITALITDQYCNPVSGVPVTFDVVTPTSGVITTVIGTTGDDGIATATLTDAVAETVQATATIAQGTVNGSPVSVTFDAGLFSYSKSTFTVTPVADTSDTTTWVPVSDGTGTDYYTGVLTAMDADGNLLDSLTLTDIAFTASSTDVTVTSVTNTGNGTYSVQFSSEVADATTTASVTYKTSPVGLAQPIPFVAGAPVPGPVVCPDASKTGTNVSASPTELAVDDDSTITALVTDQYCNPVSGVPVTFGVVTPTSGTITTVIGTTGADGIATATLTDTVSETVQATATITQGTVNGSPVSVTFDAGLFSYTKSTFTVTPVANLSDQSTWVAASTGASTYTGTLTAKDGDGNLLDNLTLTDIAFAASTTDVTVTSVTNTGNGTYSVQYSSTVADATPTATVTYKATAVGTALPIPFKAGTAVTGPVTCPDATKTGTNVSANPTEVAVDDTSTITALITDQYCNPVSGATVTFGVVTPTSGTITTVVGTTGANGIATATLTDTVSETVQATATITQGPVYGSPVSVTFDAGLFSYTKSTFTVTPVANLSDQSTWVTASTGASTYTGTLTAKDGDGNPLNNLTLTDIAFAASSGTVAITTVVNNHDGTYTVTYSSTAADPSTTATVTYKATAVGTALPIPFKAGTAVTGPVTCPDATKTGTNVSASPTEVAVDDTSTITALITDQYCNPVSGVPVTFGVVTPTSGVITTVIGTTGANGIATATLTDTVSETVQATATITQGPVYGSPVSVTFDAGLFSSTTSTFAVTPVVTTTDQSGWITASTGATYYIGTLTAKDSDGNLLPTLAVSDIAFAASSANVAITTVVNNHDGTYTVKYSSSVADPSTTATVTYKSSAVGTALPIPFKAGTAVPGPITCADPTKTGTNVSASPTQLGVGDTSTITALITDQYCNPVSGATVAFATISPTNGTLTTVKGTTGTDGIATATLTDTTAETVRATATIPQGTVSGSPVSVTFSTGVFSYTMSTFTVTPLDNPADESTWIRVSTGSVFYTGILTAKDSAGNLLPNLNLADIQFSASTPDVKITPVVNNNDGTYTVHFSSTLADPTATVTYRGVPVGSPVPIMFESDDPVPGPVVCPDPAMHGTNLSVDQTQLPVGELAHATALITDEFCNPVAGVVVTFSTSPTSTGVLVPSATTGPDGVATATLTDTAGETVALHAMLGTTDIFDSPQNVTFVQATPAPTITMPGSNADLNTATPTLSGTGTTPGDTITVKDAQGATVCTTTVTPAKTWTCPVPAPGLGNGTHTLRATETDSYNQVSAPSTPLTLTVDTIPPSQPTVTQANKTAISGTVPGTNNPGTTVTITYPKSDGTTGSVTVPMDTTTNTWTTSTPSDAVSGPITVIATDPAGNTSPTATATLDVTAPQQPTVTTANTKQISGTVPGNNNPGTTVTVTYKTTNGTTATASTTINPDGSWSMTTPSDAVTGPITVIATDPAGNTSPTATATLDLTVPQNATITQANKAGVAGTVPGSNEPGTTVTITWPDGSTTTGVQVNADGTWSVPTPSGMPSGTISVTATNPAGNSSTPVTAFLDTSTPAAPTVNPTNGTEISGTADAGGTVHVTDSSGATIPGCDNVQVGDDGTFACHPTTPLEPGTVVNVSVTSKAGNPSSPTQVTIQVLTIEVAYPTLNPMETQTVTGYPFNQGEQVCLTMPDDSLSLGCGPADDQGMVSISFTVPSSMSIGAHVVRLTGEVSGWVETSFDVTVVPTVPTGGAVVESQQFPFGVLFAGSIMVVAGLWMTSTVRRHRDRHHLSTR